MNKLSINADLGARQQVFEQVLSREPFTGLKAILDALSPDPEALCEAVNGADSYKNLLARLGYRITLTKQIHVQDAYSRLYSAEGIRAVLPYHDIPTQRSLPTLINLDSTVTTTPQSADFFDELFAAFRTELGSANAEPV